jgi:hypothetical protein
MALGRAQISSLFRARRFPLHLPVWYRRANEREWHTGVTRSISITGATIQPDEPDMPTGPLVIAIPLPVYPGCLIGRGRIVRTVAVARSTQPTFAVAVDRYRIARRDTVLRPAKP